MASEGAELVARGVCLDPEFGSSIFTMGRKWLGIAYFPTSVRAVFPATSRKELSNFLPPRARTYYFHYPLYSIVTLDSGNVPRYVRRHDRGLGIYLAASRPYDSKFGPVPFLF